MAVAYECDICGKIVASESREMPAEYVAITFQSYTEKHGFGTAFDRIDTCHDCHAKIQGFIKTVKSGGKKYEWKAVK